MRTQEGVRAEARTVELRTVAQLGHRPDPQSRTALPPRSAALRRATFAADALCTQPAAALRRHVARFRGFQKA